MFDLSRITCDYPLPISEELLKDMKSPPDWEKMEFHLDTAVPITDNMFSRFSIESDGLIYEEIREIDVNEKGDMEAVSTGLEKKEYTGQLNFHGIHLEEKYDFLMSFNALFWKGDLKEIDLTEWKKEDNTKRVEFQNKTMNIVKKQTDKLNKWWYKPWLYLSSVLRFFLMLAARFLGFLLRCVSSVESRLA